MFSTDSMPSRYIGRIAPSPTGAQHLGNARTYLVAWLLAQLNRGELLLRIEDLDTPRTKMGAAELIFEDLRWLGIDWNPTTIEPSGARSSYIVQSDRIERHRSVLEVLKGQELVYPCTCSRKEIEESSSAPHESSSGPIDGVVYPGKCAGRRAVDAQGLDEQSIMYAWRFRFPDRVVEWGDLFAGHQKLNPRESLGDFVVARNYGPPAYQLSVVVDDHDSGVNQVVRGDDLIYSTYRQLALYEALGWHPPEWFHVPLVVGEDGKRLAKRHGDTRLASLREGGMSGQQMLGILAYSLGIRDNPSPVTILELKELVLDQPALLAQIPKKAVQIRLDPYSTRSPVADSLSKVVRKHGL